MQQQIPKTKKAPTATGQPITPDRTLQAACLDPGVHSEIERVTSRRGPAPGYWSIYTIHPRATVKNQSSGAYVTRPSQQAVAIGG